MLLTSDSQYDQHTGGVILPIPRSQLDTWSNQGATVTSQKTHESIRIALESYEWPPGVTYDVYLQGSYRNTTNIYGNSDVDLVVELTSAFQYDISNLSLSEQGKYRADHSMATYRVDNFKDDVIQALHSYYGSSLVSRGNKSIKLSAGSNRLAADIVPCIEYHAYRSYRSLSDHDCVRGITFYTERDHRQVINFPKIHYGNGASKNSQAGMNYKPTVRMFKNARNRLIGDGNLLPGVAPSYFVECLLYNVPSEKFVSNPCTTFYNVLEYLHATNPQPFICQNEQTPLFGSSAEQWSTTNATQLVNGLVSLWNNW